VAINCARIHTHLHRHNTTIGMPYTSTSIHTREKKRQASEEQSKKANNPISFQKACCPCILCLYSSRLTVGRPATPTDPGRYPSTAGRMLRPSNLLDKGFTLWDELSNVRSRSSKHALQRLHFVVSGASLAVRIHASSRAGTAGQ